MKRNHLGPVVVLVALMTAGGPSAQSPLSADGQGESVTPPAGVGTHDCVDNLSLLVTAP